ncbi:MAG: hypothetical protein JWR73_1013, partial [Tardiphaga sp.]|nr:hypothetical protein [Tardiphaga sp.]
MTDHFSRRTILTAAAAMSAGVAMPSIG